MRNYITAFTLFVCTALLQACSGPGRTIITPESLIDRSSERVTFSLAAPSARQDIAEWLIKDAPSRAELECAGNDGVCEMIAQEIDRRGIPVQMGVVGGQPKAVLIYDRFMARACDNRYKDNAMNPYNSNHSALGCSVSSNVLQSVADGNQFVNPPLMDNSPGGQAVKAIRGIGE